MGAHQPEVWISDRYSAQQKHGAANQTCLAHLARDTAFALEHGSDDLPLRFKLWFGKAFDLAADIADFASATIASKKRALETQLADILGAATECDLALKLQAKIGRARDQLLTFCDYPGEVEATLARHMWNGPLGKHFLQTFHPTGTVRSYVRPFSAVIDRWP